MGASMCGHLLARGFSATVHNRTRSKAERLLAQGAVWADSPREVAQHSDVVFTIVGFPRDVREVVLGPEGALAGSKPGSILVDMTTSEPSLAIEIAAAAREKGVVSLDAPVSGGDVGAREARLSIMIGGDADAIEALHPCWEVMGKTFLRQGGPGAGQHTKLVNQTLIASNMVGVCEALLYGYRAGLDLNRVLESVASGAAGSWSLSNLGPRIIRTISIRASSSSTSSRTWASRWTRPGGWAWCCPAWRWPISCTWPSRPKATAGKAPMPCSWRWLPCPASTGTGVGDDRVGLRVVGCG
jgi:3-hydroxyisobutyrate dehydrogenase